MNIQINNVITKNVLVYKMYTFPKCKIFKIHKVSKKISKTSKIYGNQVISEIQFFSAITHSIKKQIN